LRNIFTVSSDNGRQVQPEHLGGLGEDVMGDSDDRTAGLGGLE